jgi:minor extracellular serine protease Vpr
MTTGVMRDAVGVAKGKLPLALASAAVVSLLLAASVSASGRSTGGFGTDARNETPTAWFVQLAGAPAVNGGSKAVLDSQRKTFLAAATNMGLSVTQRFAFNTLWNGLSVDVPASQAGELAAVPGVKAVYPVNLVSPALSRSVESATGGTADGQLPISGGSSDIDLAHSTTMIGSNIANAAGYTGDGVEVAVIDSGVDYNHPDLGGGFGAGHKVVGGYDFVGDLFDSNPANSTYSPVPHPDNNPAPCDPSLADQRAQQPGAGVSDAGHGTHVAGIVGAKAASVSGVTGVAPDAKILAYRVFGCNGSTSDDIIIAALERALHDGAQVVNMSLGDAFNNFADSPDAETAANLVNEGVVVVASAGNSGVNGLFSVGAPSVGNGVISVASVQNLSFPAPSFDVSNGATTLHVTYLRLADTIQAPTSGSPGDIVYVGRGCVADSSLGLTNDDAYLADPNGKVALIIRGTCSFNVKYARAVAAGATAVIIMNDGTAPDRVGNFNGGFTTDLGVPGVTISYTDGVAIQGMSEPRTMTWTANILDAPDPLAGFISSFSSWGLASDLASKPDVSAPGGNIKSTWPLAQFGGYNVISGTSMSSPHVAGAVADYLDPNAHPNATPAQVADALRNTSLRFNLVNSTRADSTARQGAGLIKIADAINAPVTIAPSGISLGDDRLNPNTPLTLTNASGSPVTYSLANQSAVTEDPFGGTYPFTFGTFFFGHVVSFSAPSVTVPAHGTATVSASIAAFPDAWDPTAIYGGFLTFTPTAGSTQTLRVPYTGFVGDYQDAITPLGGGGCNLPLLAHFGSSSDSITCSGSNLPITGFTPAPNGGQWNQPKQDPVVFLWHLDHQVRELTVTLVDAATGQPYTQGGRNPVLYDVDRVPRNSTPTAYSGLVWDGSTAIKDNVTGKTVSRAVPGGTYKLVLTVTKVKAFDDTRDAETQTITSPAITLRDG